MAAAVMEKTQVRFCRLKFADRCHLDSIFYLIFWEADGGRGTSTSLTTCESQDRWTETQTQS